MQYVSATDARNSLSKVIDMAQREPVIIQRQGREVAVVLSPQDFARITEDNRSDFLAFCESTGQKAVAAGLGESTLANLLADDT